MHPIGQSGSLIQANRRTDTNSHLTTCNGYLTYLFIMQLTQGGLVERRCCMILIPALTWLISSGAVAASPVAGDCRLLDGRLDDALSSSSQEAQASFS
jgi:hypothetical protein